jgi:hypothetical protein
VTVLPHRGWTHSSADLSRRGYRGPIARKSDWVWARRLSDRRGQLDSGQGIAPAKQSEPRTGPGHLGPRPGSRQGGLGHPAAGRPGGAHSARRPRGWQQSRDSRDLDGQIVIEPSRGALLGEAWRTDTPRLGLAILKSSGFRRLNEGIQRSQTVHPRTSTADNRVRYVWNYGPIFETAGRVHLSSNQEGSPR